MSSVPATTGKTDDVTVYMSSVPALTGKTDDVTVRIFHDDFDI